MLYRGGEYQPLSQSHVRAFTLILNFVRQTYLRLQINSLGSAHANETSDYFTAAFNTIACSSESTIWSQYEDFSVVREYHATEIAFRLKLCSSSSAGTSSPSGKLQTNIGAMHSFTQVDFEKPTNRTDT